MKTLTLNFKIWKCGDDGGKNVAHGKGETRLLNKEGYMCCLGQFATQLNPQVKRCDMLGRCNPSNVSKVIPVLSKKIGMATWNIDDTKLTNSAIEINDDMNTSIKEKIKKLKSLFRKKGYKIKVTNLPKTLKS